MYFICIYDFPFTFVIDRISSGNSLSHFLIFIFLNLILLQYDISVTAAAGWEESSPGECLAQEDTNPRKHSMYCFATIKDVHGDVRRGFLAPWNHQNLLRHSIKRLLIRQRNTRSPMQRGKR